jgi:hypothetical protein
MNLRPLFHVELHYHVLAALDLKRDAASIYSGRQAPWAKKLLAAYLAAPGRLVVQGVPLIADDLAGLLTLLRSGRLSDLADPAGRALGSLVAETLEAEREARQAFWDRNYDAAREREHSLAPWLADLEGLLAEAWKSAAPPPALDVHDCPSLAAAARDGTHGRGMLWRGRIHVALALGGGPLEQVLCQLVHEALHSVTDPPIRAAHAGVRHDSRADEPAFALHRELERAAVDEGQRLIDLRLPRLAEAYRHWRRRHGC